MKKRTGILLVQLGTPKDPTTSAVRPYLSEFLNDPRVIDIPALALRRRNASREEEGEADEKGDTQATWLEWAIAGTAFALVGFMFWAVAHEFKRISANPMILTSVFAGLAALWGGWLLWQINKKVGTWRSWLERGALVIIVQKST